LTNNWGERDRKQAEFIKGRGLKREKGCRSILSEVPIDGSARNGHFHWQGKECSIYRKR